MTIRSAFLVLKLAWLLASTCYGGEWTGIRAYVREPELAWSGRSSCGPCNLFFAEVRVQNKKAEATSNNPCKVGYTEYRLDGSANHIVILKAMDDEPTPHFVQVINGVETGKEITGYNAADPTKNVAAIYDLHPNAVAPKPVTPIDPNGPDTPAATTYSTRRTVIKTPVKVQRIEAQRTFVEPMSYAVPLAPVRYAATYSTNAYTPHWTWPGDLKSHLVKHGYSLAYLNTLSRDQMEALHDKDHDSGRVTPYGVQVRPIQQAYAVAAAPVYYAPLRATPTYQTQRHSSGLNFGGFKIGGYSSGYRSNCPGGVCP